MIVNEIVTGAEVWTFLDESRCLKKSITRLPEKTIHILWEVYKERRFDSPLDRKKCVAMFKRLAKKYRNIELEEEVWKAL